MEIERGERDAANSIASPPRNVVLRGEKLAAERFGRVTGKGPVEGHKPTGRATAEDFSVVCRELRPMFAVKPFECRGAGRASVVKVFLTTARKRALFLARKTSFSLPAISRI